MKQPLNDMRRNRQGAASHRARAPHGGAGIYEDSEEYGSQDYEASMVDSFYLHRDNQGVARQSHATGDPATGKPAAGKPDAQLKDLELGLKPRGGYSVKPFDNYSMIGGQPRTKPRITVVRPEDFGPDRTRLNPALNDSFFATPQSQESDHRLHDPSFTSSAAPARFSLAPKV